MAVFQWGTIIRNRREEMGLSQEELADGICSVPTLSRIENGERMPTKNHFEMLMQRLGYSAMSLDFFTDKRDFQIHELKFKIRQAYVTQNYTLAKRLLSDIESLVGDGSKIDDQFIVLYQTLLNEDLYTNTQRLEKYENALKLTSPKYRNGRIPHVLSYEEIVLLNNIAICHFENGDRDKALEILFAVKDYYEYQVINGEEAIRTQPMVLYNLTKVLGATGRYDECIEICDVGIRIARSTGRCNALDVTLFNKGWALMQRNLEGDVDSAKTCIQQAKYFAEVMGKTTLVGFLAEYIEKSFEKRD